MSQSEYIQVVLTADSHELAMKIGEHLVHNKMAACCQISGPITSVFHWKEKIHNVEEYYCVLKTRRSLFTEIEKAIKELHPYEVPEIIAIPIIHGSDDYLAWIDDIVRS